MGCDEYGNSQHQPWQAGQQQNSVFKILSPEGGQASSRPCLYLCGSE